MSRRAAREPGDNTLVVVENLASGTSAWSGTEGLSVEAVHNRMKTAYDLTLIAIPGDAIVLTLVQPDDGRSLDNGDNVLDAIAAILTALPDNADHRLTSLPRPSARAPIASVDTSAAQPVRFATRPRSTLEAQIANEIADLCATPQDGNSPRTQPDLDTDFWSIGIDSLRLIQLAARLEQCLSRAVPVSLLLEHPSGQSHINHAVDERILKR